MDNFAIDVSAEEKKDLVHALSLIMGQHRRMTHYRVKTEPFEDRGAVNPREGTLNTLILFWTDPGKEATAFDKPMDNPYDLANWVMKWLEHIEYPPRDFDDEDIWEVAGWRVYNEKWGRVDDEHYSSCGIEPRWCWYGK